MQREILVGGQRFVVDDPNQSLVPLMEYDQIAKHDDPNVVKGIRDIERLNPIEPMPRNCDPMGHIRGEGRMYEGIARGNIHGWALAFAWFVFGTPAIVSYMLALIALGNGSHHTGLGNGLAIVVLLATPQTFYLYLLCLGTMAWWARRRIVASGMT
jgi:hypothetical protein